MNDVEKTNIELLKEMQESEKIDVVYELEKILGQEFRSAVLSIFNENDWTQEQKDKMLSHKFKGKTVLEWEIEANQARGLDESGNPAWYGPHTNMIDALTLVKILYLNPEQL